MALRAAFLRSGKRKSENDLRRRREQDELSDSRPYTSGLSSRSNDIDDLPPPVPRLSDTYRGSSESENSNSLQVPRSKYHRFSILRFRNASDTQLGKSAMARNESTDDLPPVPRISKTPSIITTSPTLDVSEPEFPDVAMPARKRKDKQQQASSGTSLKWSAAPKFELGSDDSRPTSIDGPTRRTFEDTTSRSSMASTAHFDDQVLSLHPPTPRLSESSRSTTSSVEHAHPPQKSSSSSNFFKFGRKKKAPLFPLPDKVPADQSIFKKHGMSKSVESSVALQPPEEEPSPLPSPSRSINGLPFSASPGPLASILRNKSSASVRSGRSSHSLTGIRHAQHRRRSSTFGSFDAREDRSPLPSPIPPPRSSTSASRSSFVNLFAFSQRGRHQTEPVQKGSLPETPVIGTPLSDSSASNTTSLRSSFVVPEREDDDTPATYLDKLQESVSRSMIATIASKSNDTFHQAVLRKHMRQFAFFGDPMDMSIRKLLMEVELPKETQQIDRVLQAFADRYHECNPGIFASTDQAYFIAFSILILHTDVFNKNNKHKMQKQDYLKNTRTEDMFDEILECFYDNICYTPFIRVEDEHEYGSMRHRKTFFSKTASETKGLITREPTDPYALIMEGDLNNLRPSLKDVMRLEDVYSYLGNSKWDIAAIHRSFFKSGVLQIMSARSRPDAFKSPDTTFNPIEAQPGVVDLKVTKVGILWRKNPKKKKTRSPWEEWGAILTGSQLYFFRNTSWIKGLMHQFDSHRKANPGSAVIFTPPLDSFKADALMSTDEAVAVVDSSYKTHKHAFLFVRHGGLEDKFLADSEEELDDWTSKLNYAATFKSARVRMRALVNTEATASDSESSEEQSESESETLAQRIRNDDELAQQIIVTRRQIMAQKIEEAGERIVIFEKDLEVQLRNARHLQLLTPIQPKTREYIILSAANYSQKIKWTRLEILRLKCHRDVMLQDLEDEKPGSTERSLRLSAATAENGIHSPLLLEKPLPKINPKRMSMGSTTSVPVSLATVRPGSRGSQKDGDILDDPIKSHDRIMQQLEAASPLEKLISAHPQTFMPRIASTTSTKSIASTQSLPQPPSISPDASDIARLVTGTPDLTMEESDVLKRAGVLQSNAILERTSSEIQAESLPMLKTRSVSGGSLGAGIPKPKARRSLHRTLREAHLPTHRAKKAKDGTSSGKSESEATISEKEGLARTTGSFTLHGKKASVVTFGAEWEGGDAEERIRMQRPSKSKASGTALDDESIASEAESIRSFSSRRRRESAASSSTTTARSFRRDLSRDREAERTLGAPESLQVERPRTPLETISDNDQRWSDGSSRKSVLAASTSAGQPILASE